MKLDVLESNSVTLVNMKNDHITFKVGCHEYSSVAHRSYACAIHLEKSSSTGQNAPPWCTRLRLSPQLCHIISIDIYHPLLPSNPLPSATDSDAHRRAKKS